MRTTDITNKDDRLSEDHSVGALGAFLGYLFGSILLLVAFIMAMVLDTEINDYFNAKESALRFPVFIVSFLGAIGFLAGIKCIKFAAGARSGGVLIAAGLILVGVAVGFVFRTAVDNAVTFLPVTALMGIGFLVIGFITRRRARAIGMAGIQGPDFFGLNMKTARRLRDSAFSKHFQTPIARRLVAAIYVAFILGVGFTFVIEELRSNSAQQSESGLVEGAIGSYSEDASKAPREDIKNTSETANGPSSLIGFFILGGILVAGVFLDQALFLCLKPVIALEGETLDERQKELVQSANADARIVSIGVIASIALLGLSGIAPVTLGILAVMGGVLAYMTPHIILAWSLPAEEDDDDMLLEEGA